MTETARSLPELTHTGIRLLSRELGVADTLRFLSQFTTGTGDYTEERHALLGDPSVEELFAEARRREVLLGVTGERR